MPSRRPKGQKPEAGKSSAGRKSDGRSSSGGRKPKPSSGGKPSGGKPTFGKPPAKQQARPPSTAFQRLTEMLKWVDLVIEVLDARVPLSTRHPRAAEIFGTKPRLVVLTKEDIADKDKTKNLLENIKAETGYPCILVSLKSGSGRNEIMNMAIDATKEKLDALVKKGILPRPMRVCVVGLPNVGKSSLINWLIGQKSAKTGNKPGVTKGTQWVRVHPKLELLDTPGILPIVSFAKPVQMKLATCNLLPESNYDYLEIAEYALAAMREKYPRSLERYAPGMSAEGKGLIDIAQARNLLTSGAKPDINRAAALFISELRDGKVGRFTLDP